MRLLIITSNIGHTPPGIAFERIINGLSLFHEIDVITSDYQPSIDLPNVKNVFVIENIKLNAYLRILSVCVFNVDITDLLWSFRTFHKVRHNLKYNYDIVVSFISAGNCKALLVGTRLSKFYNLKHIVYSVDAIPPPKEWKLRMIYRHGLLEFVKKRFKNIDAILLSNQQMLAYQLSLFKHKKNLISDVIYTPSLYKDIIDYGEIICNENIFLYTGSIYGARKVNYLLDGFRKLLQEYPNSRLVFVGTNSKILLEENNKVSFYPFSTELTSFYEKATALIDIDADIDDDIFLSSKITNYININRIIISETGLNSPSRYLFKGIKSIFQCEHNMNDMYNAMKLAIMQKNDMDYSDRKDVLNLLNISTAIDKFNSIIQKLIYH